MKILFLTTHFNTGGITSYVVTLARGLAKKNHTVYVASSGGNMTDELASSGIGHFPLNIRTKSEMSPKIYFALKPLAEFIKEKDIDVIHTQTRVTQVMGTLLKKMTGRAHIATCHGFFRTRLFRKIFPCWGSATIAISAAVREHLIRDFGLTEQKVFLVHNGLDLEKFIPISESLRQEKRREFSVKNGPVIGMIARLSEVKGHTVLIAAMKRVVERVNTVVLLIIGEGRQDLHGDAGMDTAELGRPVGSR